jgi:hypothetical protein
MTQTIQSKKAADPRYQKKFVFHVTPLRRVSLGHCQADYAAVDENRYLGG